MFILFFLQVLMFVPRTMVDAINFAFTGETHEEHVLVRMVILRKMEFRAWDMKVTCCIQEEQY